MLRMGSSEEWTDALEAITGNRTMSAQPLIDYFNPLMEWLTNYNQENGHSGDDWENDCPTKLPKVTHSLAVVSPFL